MLCQPGRCVQRLSTRLRVFHRRGPVRQHRRQRFELFARDDLDVLWHLRQARHAVWPFGEVIALACHGAIELPDAGRVVDGGVNVLPVATKQIVQGLQRALNKLSACIIVRQRNPVEQVRPIAAVRLYRLWPTLARQEVTHLTRPLERIGMFFVASRCIGWPLGVHINGEPPPRCNVRVLGVASRTLLQRVECDVDAFGVRVQRQGLVRKLVRVGEALRDGIRLLTRLCSYPDSAQLNLGTRLRQDSERVQDFISTSGHWAREGDCHFR